ncbi:hypothetical protein GmHk_15G044740 [Glycine max]|nr:hypothetical protein GmHk_15G044740 [Glycine max]
MSIVPMAECLTCDSFAKKEKAQTKEGEEERETPKMGLCFGCFSVDKCICKEEERLTSEEAHAKAVEAAQKRNEFISFYSMHPKQLQESQDAHHNIIHPQSEFHSSLMAMGSGHTQSL